MMKCCAVKWCVCFADGNRLFCAVHHDKGELYRLETLRDGETMSVEQLKGDCVWCDGSGECSSCEGSGDHECECGDQHSCRDCDGSGDCDMCHGTGYERMRQRAVAKNSPNDRDRLWFAFDVGIVTKTFNELIPQPWDSMQ